MNTPQFTGQESLYRSTTNYVSLAPTRGSETVGVAPAYFPGPKTQERCNDCLESAQEHFGALLLSGGALCAVGCIAAGPFYALCLAPCLGGVLAMADLTLLEESARCAATKCCPKMCGTFNPFDPGAGCCDNGESCVDRYDKNSRQGCCPADQSVCGGKCCAQGERCCGETCCPAGHFCREGFCSDSVPFSQEKPPPPPKLVQCAPGDSPCGTKCCPPGLECCSVGNGRVECMTNCLA